MSNPGMKSGNGLLLAGILAGLLFLWSQKSLPVTAGEPDHPNTIEVSAADLSDAAPQTDLPIVHMALAGKKYKLEVAMTPEQEQTGLMFRTKLAAGHGMLFPFHPARPVNFWMKNTKIPLDMLFLNHGQVVNIVHDAQPCTSDPCPEYPSLYAVDNVVELPAGTARKDGIEAGCQAVFEKPGIAPSPPATAPLNPPDRKP
jgi:uncharacterized membrane protein (UPF0127 family)